MNLSGPENGHGAWRHYLSMTDPIDTLHDPHAVALRDLVAELAIRRFEDDPLERWIEATWPLRSPEDSVRRALVHLPSIDLARLVLERASAMPLSIIITPGEPREAQNDLREVIQMTTEAQRRAREATVAILRAPTVTRLPGGEFTFSGEIFRGCAGEPFAGQSRGAHATGVLVGPELVLTAGHYVASRPAKSMYFFFDHFVDAEGRPPERFPAAAVYRGQSIVAITHLPPSAHSPGSDWALVKLDRPVEGRRPLAIRRAGKIADHRPLFVVGHPAGFPMKYALDGVVIDNAAEQQFRTSLDIAEGGSGSPVFDAEADEPIVEGIVARAGRGFINDPTNPDCMRYFVTSEADSHGPVCTRATACVDYVPPLP